MSKANADQAKEYRDRIESMLKSVPDSVKNGSYQRSVAYKDAVDKANKALKAPNSLAKLSSACNLLAGFY